MRKNRGGIFCILLLLVNASSLVIPAYSQSEIESQLKPDVPKLDIPPIAPKPAAPLKGSVHHSEHLPDQSNTTQSGHANDSQFNGMAGKAQTGSGNPLKGRSSKRNLFGGTESGIGIIGVKFLIAFGRLPVINRVFKDTPAAENDLRPNDIIIAVDGIPTRGLTKNEIYNMIVGPPHTPVTISVRRRGDFLVRTMERMDFNEITDPKVRRDYQRM